MHTQSITKHIHCVYLLKHKSHSQFGNQTWQCQCGRANGILHINYTSQDHSKHPRNRHGTSCGSGAIWLHLHKREDTLCDPGCQNRTGEHNEKQQKDETRTKQDEKQAMSATEQNTGTEHDWNFSELCKTTFKN